MKPNAKIATSNVFNALEPMIMNVQNVQ